MNRTFHGKNIVLLCVNTLFFVFAYNLLRCAYFTYIAEIKAVGGQDIGKVISLYAQKAFIFLVLFVVLKFIYLLVTGNVEKE